MGRSALKISPICFVSFISFSRALNVFSNRSLFNLWAPEASALQATCKKLSLDFWRHFLGRTQPAAKDRKRQDVHPDLKKTIKLEQKSSQASAIQPQFWGKREKTKTSKEKSIYNCQRPQWLRHIDFFIDLERMLKCWLGLIESFRCPR